MPSFNKVLLMGNLTRDPELKYIPSGKAVANFGIAVNFKETVTFVEVTAWEKLGENCAEYLSKGRPVFVEGRLDSQQWETEAGEKRNKLVVVAINVQFLGEKKEDIGF